MACPSAGEARHLTGLEGTNKHRVSDSPQCRLSAELGFRSVTCRGTSTDTLLLEGKASVLLPCVCGSCLGSATRAATRPGRTCFATPQGSTRQGDSTLSLLKLGKPIPLSFPPFHPIPPGPSQPPAPFWSSPSEPRRKVQFSRREHLF